jgi:FkbM family methyltransferase
MTGSDYVALMYQSLLGRNPDPEGLVHYSGVLERTGDLRLVVDALTGSNEFRQRHSAKTNSEAPSVYPVGRSMIIVDVGAQKLAGEDHIYSPLMTAGIEWRCIGFEPLDHRRQSRLDMESDPRLTMLDAFIGDGRRHTFRKVSDDGSSSLLALNEQFIRGYEHICTLETTGVEEVETRTLDEMLAGEPRIDFLKFDIQGFETRALDGAAKVLKRANVIHCECFFGPMYLDQGYFADVDRILRAAGFEFIDFSYLARYRYVAVPMPSTAGERLIWADAVYFRKLDLAHDDRSSFRAQAAIAELVYRKPGLAQSVLQRLEPGPVSARC